MGNGICCKSRKKDFVDDGSLLSQIKGNSFIEGIHIDKFNFIKFKEDEKFKDNYLLGQSLGCSTYGEVRKCKNIRTNAVRAVKILKRDCLDQFETKLIMNEIELLKHLDHPNILKLYEVYIDEKRLYIITELCNGGELYDVLTQEKKLTEKMASIIIHQVISVVAYCHR